MFIKKIMTLAILYLFVSNLFAAGYDIKRAEDGDFSFSISGIKINEGSTLKRESILFNDESCPVTIISNSMSIEYKDRSFQHESTTKLNVKNNVKAIQVRTIQYDLFGQHMQNLANTEAKDFPVGEASISGTWRARENDVAEFLTSVTYVARVRFEDGTQWVFNTDNLQLALTTLKLEKTIGEDEE